MLSKGTTVNFGKTATDYSKFRAGFPKSFFRRLCDLKLIKGHEKVLDLGTGTGTVARGLANLGCHVTALDPSKELLNEAKIIADKEKLQISFCEGIAEDTKFDSKYFNVVTAGQCWHWFSGMAAAREINRILKPSGVLIICHFDWIPINKNIVRLTLDLIKNIIPNGTLVVVREFIQIGLCI